MQNRIFHHTKAGRLAPCGTRVAAIAVLCVGMAAILSTTASAQMYEQAWQFKQRDRASLAVVQKQVEEGLFSRSRGSSSSGSSSLGSSSSTLLLCGGGDSQSSAEGNSSCIILNNATGDLTIGQDATGDQSASANTETTTSNTTTADEVSEILNEGAGSE